MKTVHNPTSSADNIRSARGSNNIPEATLKRVAPKFHKTSILPILNFLYSQFILYQEVESLMQDQVLQKS